MRIIAIDPGSEQSAVVWLINGTPIQKDILPNNEVVEMLEGESKQYRLVIEMIASYGLPVGREVFETCVWIGRFMEAWNYDCTRVYRRDIKHHFCNSAKATDANVSCVMRDRFGGSKCKGTKKQPGPLFGFSKDLWQALAAGLYYYDTHKEN